MSSLDPPDEVVDEVVTRTLAEDLGRDGDVTSRAVVPVEVVATGRFVAREAGVLAGTKAAGAVLRRVDPSLTVAWTSRDGEELHAGECFGTVHGTLRSILTAERSALNMLTHCSGVATLTRAYVSAADGRAAIRDTRKTLPGLRAIEKAAVRAGGGHNHRHSLSDAVLIKDNHLAHSSLPDAVRRSRKAWPDRVVEVECDTLDQVAAAVRARPDLILVDNMGPTEVSEAVALAAGAVPVEVSGGVALDMVPAYARTGADYISVGAITHSAAALDLALELPVAVGKSGRC